MADSLIAALLIFEDDLVPLLVARRELDSARDAGERAGSRAGHDLPGVGRNSVREPTPVAEDEAALPRADSADKPLIAREYRAAIGKVRHEVLEPSFPSQF